MPSGWNGNLKWGKKNIKLKVVFLVVSQPSCSYRYQSACLSVLVCNAGDTGCRGEEGIFLRVPRHLSHQKHTAVVMQVSLQQNSVGARQEDSGTLLQQRGLLTLHTVLPVFIFLGTSERN